jgi:hypothetical protein
VLLDFEQTDVELAHLMAHDSNAFNRPASASRPASCRLGGNRDSPVFRKQG